MKEITIKPDTPRWMYRFDNYSKALSLLSEAAQLSKTRALSALEKEGVIQRFEYTWELAWKVLKDYLEHQGIVLATITPTASIKAALAAQVIDEGDVWIAALDARNKMSHVYNAQQFEAIIAHIETDFLRILKKLHAHLTNSFPN